MNSCQCTKHSQHKTCSLKGLVFLVWHKHTQTHNWTDTLVDIVFVFLKGTLGGMWYVLKYVRIGMLYAEDMPPIPSCCSATQFLCVFTCVVCVVQWMGRLLWVYELNVKLSALEKPYVAFNRFFPRTIPHVAQQNVYSTIFHQHTKSPLDSCAECLLFVCRRSLSLNTTSYNPHFR